jgi:hypothetical protein
MTVDTTFLPKTNGMVFGDRLVARANKGRVFLLVAPGDEIVEPPPPPPTIGTVTATIDGAPYDIAVGAPVAILSGDSVVLATSISGDASPSYTWTVKSGSASITGTGSTVTALIDTVAPGSVQIQCDIIDANASDNPFSFRYAFLIGE